MPPALLAILIKYKQYLLYAAVILVGIMMVWSAITGFEAHKLQVHINQQQSQIIQLQQTVASDDLKIAQFNGQLVQATEQVVKSNQLATAAQAKVNILLAKYEPSVDTTDIQDAVLPALPEVPNTFTDLPACEKEVATLQVDLGTMVVEIKSDRTLISNLQSEVAILDQKDTVIVQENVALKSIETSQSTIIIDTTKQLSTEKTKTTFWRRVGLGALTAASILILHIAL